ncbi:hypothetical protein BGX34_000794 [Mortierella sp. NVP85]|nr:hypothetical protein BGX34_000794 [Mortierella sp. NVP85]
MNDSAIPTTSSPTVTPRRLVRQQTPLPSRYESSSDEEIALKLQTASNTAMNRNMLSVNRTLFWNLASQQDHYSESESDSDSDSDNDNSSSSDDDSSNSEDEDEDKAGSQETSPESEDDNNGRERDSSIMDLSSGSTFSFSWPTSTTTYSLEMSSPPLAMQADKKSKRIRIDPNAVVSGKKVRFDEARNKVHLHYRQSTISPPGTPAKEVCSPSARPLKSALTKRLDQPSLDASLSPRPFQLSLDNTSQEVMDFASSLTRLMGGSSGSSGSQEQFLSPPSMSQLSVGSPISGSSPLRSFAMFKHAPPSPVRPPFMSASYSPPRTSSLSSCWSPTLSEDEGNGNEGASAGSAPEGGSLSPSRPTIVQGRATVRFTPRRPRNQTASPSSSATAPGSPKPRFPAMLKREASNASFLDNYPSSLTPESVQTSESPSMSPRDDCPAIPAAVIVQNGETMDHAAIAAAVLNMASSLDNHA